MTGIPQPHSAWIRRYHPAPKAEVRVVAFPHAGGSATYFFPASQALSPDVELLAVQYPGRQDRRHEEHVDDLHRLADLVVPEILPYADRPLVLFGHSMGATLAFEVALRMARAGVVPKGLFVTGRRAPSSFRDERVHLYRDDDFVAEVKGLSGTDPRMFEDRETLMMILPGLRSDYRAAETYRYEESAPLDCPITVLIGEDDAMVTVDEARMWGRHTTASFTLRVMPGGHFFLNEDATAVIGLLRNYALRGQVCGTAGGNR